ncbi:MAG: hypothetical protein ACOY5Y_19750 [Pseudomonadota bacterium]
MPRTWCCWTKATRSSRRPEAVLAAAALTLSACAPGAPPGVEKAELDAQVSRAIGDPNTCVLIAEAGSGRVLYRYNTATTCAREYPACDKPGARQLKDLLEATAEDGRPRTLSCNTRPDASRGVAWASGPIAGTGYVYAAVMEGDRAFPGRMVADRLEGVFRRAGVSKSEPGGS